MRAIFLSLAVANCVAMTGCVSSNQKLEREVATLRVEVDSLKANQHYFKSKLDDLGHGSAAGSAVPASKPDVAVADEVRRLQVERDVLRAQLETAKTRRPPWVRPRAKRPDPNAVYSVTLGSSSSKGARHAKVTIVESFEFA